MPLRIDHSVKGGGFEGGGPILRDRKPRSPGPATIRAAFQLDGALAVPLGIDTQNREAVLEEDGGGVSQVLPVFPVHDDLPIAIRAQIHQRNGARQGQAVHKESDQRNERKTAAVREHEADQKPSERMRQGRLFSPQRLRNDPSDRIGWSGTEGFFEK